MYGDQLIDDMQKQYIPRKDCFSLSDFHFSGLLVKLVCVLTLLAFSHSAAKQTARESRRWCVNLDWNGCLGAGGKLLHLGVKCIQRYEVTLIKPH